MSDGSMPNPSVTEYTPTPWDMEQPRLFPVETPQGQHAAFIFRDGYIRVYRFAVETQYQSTADAFVCDFKRADGGFEVKGEWYMALAEAVDACYDRDEAVRHVLREQSVTA